MDIENSRLPDVLILSDSHGKCINRTCSTRFNTKIKAVFELKWIDNRDEKLCLSSMLSLRDIWSFLSEANALLLIIGTNSVRIMPASRVIGQVREVIRWIQQNYPHLNGTKKINVACTFLCGKPTNRFPNRYLLTANINQYNEQLIPLSLEMNFTLIDFHIAEYHPGNDRMHVNSNFHYLIVDSIANHFNNILSLPSSASTSNEIEIQSQSSQRSRQSNDQRNEKRHSKLKAKLEENIIKRKIDSKWSLSDVKKYLKSIPVKYERILPIFKNTQRIQFHNEHEGEYSYRRIATTSFDPFSRDHHQAALARHNLYTEYEYEVNCLTSNIQFYLKI